MVLVALPSGHVVRRWESGFTRVDTLAFSPDGSRLAYGAMHMGVVHVCDAVSGAVLAKLPHSHGCFHLAWNPRRADVLAVACEDSAIYLWDVRTRRQTVVLKGDTYNGLVIAFHPGGELLVSRGWASVLRLWDTRTGASS